MESLYPFLGFLHVMAFVFMSVPLFNLIVVNERAELGAGFNYDADRYLENIIRRGATRCFVFQWTVFVTGILLILTGGLGIEALWMNWVLLAKTILLLTLMGLLSYVHYALQPRIEAIFAGVKPDGPIPDDMTARLKPHRMVRKRLATVCLFLVIVTIVLGLQVYVRFSPGLTVGLIVLAGLFSWRVNRTLIRFGWV